LFSSVERGASSVERGAAITEVVLAARAIIMARNFIVMFVVCFSKKREENLLDCSCIYWLWMSFEDESVCVMIWTMVGFFAPYIDQVRDWRTGLFLQIQPHYPT